MKAIVLAAGKGTRLKGVAGDLPKPMIPVRGKPVLEHNLAWLRGQGVDDVTINLHYRGDVITGHFGDGGPFGLRLRYSHEAELLGTAGAVRRIVDNVWTEAPEPFFVIYGDNLMHYELEPVAAFHRLRRSLATIVVYHKDDVSQSGIVTLDPNGRILRFIEKPRPEEAVSHLVNTGIYLLDPRAVAHIPADGPSDFGHDVFPAMLAAGQPLHAIEGVGTLVPIDTPAMLRQALGQEETP